MTPLTRSLLVVLAAVTCAAAPAHAGAATWRPEQPMLPGQPFLGPIGFPGDVAAIARNRVLLTTNGNTVFQRGLLVYDGAGWKQLASVCGTATDPGSRIAVIGPREFWVTASPNPEAFPDDRPRPPSTLCHFNDGEVVGSHAFRAIVGSDGVQLQAAGCLSPDQCWFGGNSVQTEGAAQRGAMHLRWDGRDVSLRFEPQDRAITDIAPVPGELLESVSVGRRFNNPGNPADPSPPEAPPRLLRRIRGSAIGNDRFLPAVAPGGADDDSELLALERDGSLVWAGGGQASSGPKGAWGSGREPLLAVSRGGGGFVEQTLAPDVFAPGDRIVDIAALPGTGTAWLAVATKIDTGVGSSVPARLVRVNGNGQVLEDVTLTENGLPRGAALRIDCAAPNDCWLATTGGWLFHYTDGSSVGIDTDPAFAGVIAFRPPDALTPQPTPDTLPVDDSLPSAPPPEVEGSVTRGPAPPAPKPKRLPALLRMLGKPQRVGRATFVYRFRVARRARVGIVGERRVRKRYVVVARAKPRTMKPGRHTLRMRFDRRRWPQRLRFVVRELDLPAQPPQGGGDQPDAGPDPNAPDVVTSPPTR